MKLFKLKNISKKYAMRAALYRRVARGMGIAGLDFSEEALCALHRYESTGQGSADKSKNGYAYGKWSTDLTVSMWVEDIEAGNFCKAEFLETPIQRLHNTEKLKNILSGEFFPWRPLIEARNGL